MARVFAEPPHIDKSIVRHYAGFMNVTDSSLRVPELYAAIHEWIGTPYRYGRSDLKGTDCSGFVRNIFRPLCGEELPRNTSGISKIIESKPIEALTEGDLVFFNYRGRVNSHVGIYLKNGWFVHASTVRGVTLNNLYAPYYTKRFNKGGPLKRGKLEDLIAQTRDEELPAPKPLMPVGVNGIEPPKRYVKLPATP